MYKARIVAKGFIRKGIDSHNLFLPVINYTSVRILLTVVGHMDLDLGKMDVNNNSPWWDRLDHINVST